MKRANSSKVTRKGQVTIPIEFRRLLGVAEGDEVGFDHSDIGLVVFRIPPSDRHEGASLLQTGGAVARTAGSLSKYAHQRFTDPDERLRAEKEAAAYGWTERERRYVAERDRD